MKSCAIWDAVTFYPCSTFMVVMQKSLNCSPMKVQRLLNKFGRLPFSGDFIIGAIRRGEKWVIATGQMQIQWRKSDQCMCRQLFGWLATVVPQMTPWVTGASISDSQCGKCSDIGYVFANLPLWQVVRWYFPRCSLCYGNEGDLVPLVISASVALLIGLPLRFICRTVDNLQLREAFLITTFGWVVISALSALPFVLHGCIPSFTDAFLEMMSGYTTTGATILNDIEALPHGLLMWRSETHFRWYRVYYLCGTLAATRYGRGSFV